MRTTCLAMLMAATLVGCATAPKQQARGPKPNEASDGVAAPAPAADAARPQELGGAAVKIVGHRPSPQKYHFVGRVQARATTADFVDAAIAADADLRRQAKALGADVVKIDVITPPSGKGHAHSRVILAGRAYKKSS